MKRPASVTSAIVVLALILFFALMPLFSAKRSDFAFPGVLLAPLLPLLHAIPLGGLIMRKRWARPFAICVFSAWTFGFLSLSIFQAARTKNPTYLAPGFIGGVLLLWLTITLIRSQDVKAYVQTPAATASGARVSGQHRPIRIAGVVSFLGETVHSPINR
jgi:hypothetical protein